MATRVIDDTKLNNIAVAIQAKDSGGQMTVDDMPDRINALPTGSTLIPETITQNGVYNASSDNKLERKYYIMSAYKEFKFKPAPWLPHSDLPLE